MVKPKEGNLATKSMKTPRWLRLASLGALVIAGVVMAGAVTPPSAGVNVRVTNDNDTTYVSADQLAGGTYTDGVLLRCGTDRRMQNEPTLAIDPRNTSVWTSGANDYCTVPTAGDAWAGFLPQHRLRGALDRQPAAWLQGRHLDGGH